MQTLLETSKAAKQQADLWQAQVQESLSTIARLQDCMEESAAWSSSPGTGASQAEDGSSRGDGGAAPGQQQQQQAEALQGQLLKEQADRAKLELQVRALCAELLRVHSAQQAYRKCMVPLLSGVEGRLLALHAFAAQ
jgi:hypothetical protein